MVQKMVESTETKVVDLSATLAVIGYNSGVCPAMASKFAKKCGIETGGRYIPIVSWAGLKTEMSASTSKYTVAWAKAEPILVNLDQQVSKVESRAALLRDELNQFYKALPKAMPVESLTMALSLLIGDLKTEFPDAE